MATNLLIFALLAAVTTFEVCALEVAAVDEGNTSVETKINLECTFGYSDDFGYRAYGCWVPNLNIQNDNIAVASFTSTHHHGKTDDDVEWIVFRNGTMFFIPSQVGEIFKNLKKLRVNGYLRTKRVKRSDFQGLGKLVFLEIEQNDLTTLHYDTLRDLPLLEMFELFYNNLTDIDVRTFETNVNLKEVWLSSNQIEILPKHLFANNLLLECVNATYNSFKLIDETTFETNVQLREVYLGGNKLEMLPSHLFTNNLLLEIVHLSDNLLKIIDVTTFQANIKLREVYLGWNKLEVLPRHLFTNNLRLEYVGLRANSLKIIEIDFTTLHSLTEINLKANICIDAYYEGVDATQFQNTIMSNCSSPM